jgi:thymidylate synthase (FAD)
MMEVIKETTEKSFQYYKLLIKSGVPPEQARMVLPQNMMTEFIETGSLAAYARLCNLRMGSDAQKEIQDVARLVSTALAEKFPATWTVLVSGH